MHNDDDLIAWFVNSNEIHHLVNGQEQDDGGEEDFHDSVRWELRDEFVQKQVDKATKLCQINAVPEILEIAKPILSHLNELEEHKEALCEHAKHVAEVLQQSIVHCDREYEWSEESENVKSHH